MVRALPDTHPHAQHTFDCHLPYDISVSVSVCFCCAHNAQCKLHLAHAIVRPPYTRLRNLVAAPIMGR